MEHSCPCEANRVSASQEIPRILCNPKDYYCIYKSCHLSLSWPTSIQSISPSYVLNIHFNIILPSMPTSFKWFPYLMFPYQNSVLTSRFSHTSYVPPIWPSLVGYYADSHNHLVHIPLLLKYLLKYRHFYYFRKILRNLDPKTSFQS